MSACLGGPGALAADAPAEPPARPSTAPTVDAAADAVVAAVGAKDASALASLAQRDKPDPWLVADVLCARGDIDAAEAFARAAPRPDVAALPAYVQARRGVADDGAARARLATVAAAAKAQAWTDVLRGTEEPPAATTVVELQLLRWRGFALLDAGRPEAGEGTLVAAADAAKELGWLYFAVARYSEAAASAYERSTCGRALACYDECSRLCEQRGDPYWAAWFLRDVGRSRHKLAEHGKAVETLRAVLGRMEALGRPFEVAQTLNDLGLAHWARGEYPEALDAFEKARAGFEALGAERELATALGNVGLVHQSRGDVARAEQAYAQAYDRMETSEDRAGMARMLNNRAQFDLARGDYEDARARFEQAADLYAAQGMGREAAMSRGNTGLVYESLGKYAKALAVYEEALRRLQELGDRAGEADLHGRIGNVHQGVGEHETALIHLRRALEDMELREDRHGAAATWNNIGTVQQRQGDHQDALASYEKARALMVALQSRAGEATVLGNVGVVQDAMGEHEKAIATYRRALALSKEIGDRAGEITTLANIGEAYHHLGDLKTARTTLRASARRAESLVAAGPRLAAQGMLARLELERGDGSAATSAADAAFEAMAALLEDLDDELGASAREQSASLSAVGALASVRGPEPDVPSAFRYLEAGRAGALLDSLGKREALRLKEEGLPAELRAETLESHEAERSARRAFDAAAGRGQREETAAARRSLDRALAAVRAVRGRAQRALMQQASLHYLRPDAIDDVKAALRPHEALVLYGMCLDERVRGMDEVLALVVRHDGERHVSLGKASAVRSACEALLATEPGAGAASRGALEDPQAGPAEEAWDAIAERLTGLLVRPLGLGADVTQVIVSPEGPLCYLPYGRLFDRPVAVAPSGTILRLLRKDRGLRGAGVLALGDAEYGGLSESVRTIYLRGGRLARLPGTRDEAERIGTTTLLGPRASEGGLRAALPLAKRWRAVHVACHGLVDAERPMLSSLALSPSEGDDGFLTAAEVRRMTIPADLAVLSACVTSRGKLVKGEGIVGLARSFLLAGAPRVVCSLWKVDDAATKALMLRFYERWSPPDGDGAGAAAALREAQAFVRSQPGWENPRYWAAWLLWGTPE